MATATISPSFNGFGDSILIPALRRPLVQVKLADARESCRAQIRELAPASPGVYGWVDRNQRLLYVGKSKSLRHRLLSYFDKTPSDDKSERMRQTSSRIVWEAVSHELLALIREQELIFRWRPSFNRMGQPERRRPGFICVSKGAAPRIQMSQARDHRADLCIGPVVGLSDLREAVEQLNYAFQLRDCSDRVRMNMTAQLPLFNEVHSAKCIRFELGSCLGPCSSACAPNRYHQSADQAKAFLTGGDLSILDRLKREISDAVDRRAFERAGVLHHRFISLEWLSRRLAARRRMRTELSGWFPLPSFDRQPCGLMLEQGYLAGFSRREQVSTRSRRDSEHPSEDDALSVEWMLIIASWFQKNREQKAFLQKAARAELRRRASA
jgi:excinuclease ABC subunit C